MDLQSLAETGLQVVASIWGFRAVVKELRTRLHAVEARVEVLEGRVDTNSGRIDKLETKAAA
jgi:hypothetical protein